MEEIMEKAVSELKLDKSRWSLTKFGNVAIQQKQSVDRDISELTRYVKGEHMGSEDLHLREWGELTDEYLGPAFIRKFEEGDILYGSRRTYLRKVVIAPFEGITSNTTFVIKANEKKIDKRLLPFIMMSEGFTDNSIKNSKGSVNPYINWKDIANYEFLLPPKDQQAQLAELLWAMDEVVEREREVLNTTSQYFETTRNAIFSNDISSHELDILNDPDIKEKCIEAYYKVKSANGVYKGKEFQGKGIRLINMGELFAYPIIRDEEMSLIELTAKEKEQFVVEVGDLIFARRSLVIEGAGKCSIIGEHQSPMTFESSMIRIRLNEDEINPKYVFHFLKSNEGRKRIRRIVGFTTVAGITSTDLAKVKVPTVSLSRQKQILELLEQFENIFGDIMSKITNSKALQKSLINQIF
ncbi:restriction endonuclease subunit S [Arenibacter algicola]|uniref:EcoKI restriction-modification system protein HsdS n=1 Tax=Arenibacter algicola TaxID=616991 RepID=A0A221UUV1_9FLAO|nr:restriction endonuclease subunit S [Arenibacter algicola]ASO05104.1 EcoKI restriction-modification system protein HsdS [Arenibacter algicola]